MRKESIEFSSNVWEEKNLSKSWQKFMKDFVDPIELFIRLSG